MNDKLDILFKQQYEFQQSMGIKPYKNVEYIKDMTIAAIDELMEMIRETPWKPWKKNQTFNEENFKKEIIDLWHFVINLSLAAGINSEDLYTLYFNKQNINKNRQKEGY